MSSHKYDYLFKNVIFGERGIDKIPFLDNLTTEGNKNLEFLSFRQWYLYKNH